VAWVSQWTLEAGHSALCLPHTYLDDGVA
jgi:hypothetical protein